MKKVYAGKWTLAITFILLGSTILWNMYGTPRIAIADYYPLVFIFLGLELIIKALIQKGKKVSLEIGTIILLILIMIFVNVMSYSFSFFGPRSNDLFSEDHPIGEFLSDLAQGNVIINFDSIGRFDTTYEIEETFSVEDLDTLKLQNAFGDVSVESWQQEEIKVIIQVQSSNDDEEYVEGLKEVLFSYDIEPVGTLALLSNNRRYLEDSRVKSLRMNYRIFIPEGQELSSLEIINEFGDVEVTEIETDLSINNRHGDMKIHEISEKLGVENSFGDLVLGSLSGEVNIQNRHGDITLENEEEMLLGLVIENEFGSVHLQLSKEQSGIYDLHTRFGEINQNLDLVEGGFEEAQGFNEVTFQGTVGEEETELSVNNRHGDITIETNE